MNAYQTSILNGDTSGASIHWRLRIVAHDSVHRRSIINSRSRNGSGIGYVGRPGTLLLGGRVPTGSAAAALLAAIIGHLSDHKICITI